MADESNSEVKDLWVFFRYFLGEWEGTGTGRPGISQSTRKYEMVLQDAFMQVYNRSVYEPQEKNPEGEIHEDLGFISFDKNREVHVFREFHVEGFVNQYTVESWDPEERILVFITEAIENISPGWRARTTYEIKNENEFRETFDLSGSEADWACYITNEFKRVGVD